MADLTDWRDYGYPLPLRCNPYAPWWRWSETAGLWMRTRGFAEDTPALILGTTADALLAARDLLAVDAAHPRNRPPMLAGQAWRLPRGGASEGAVTGMVKGCGANGYNLDGVRLVYSSHVTESFPAARLVWGPWAPWTPLGLDDAAEEE